MPWYIKSGALRNALETLDYDVRKEDAKKVVILDSIKKNPQIFT